MAFLPGGGGVVIGWRSAGFLIALTSILSQCSSSPSVSHVCLIVFCCSQSQLSEVGGGATHLDSVVATEKDKETQASGNSGNHWGPGGVTWGLCELNFSTPVQVCSPAFRLPAQTAGIGYSRKQKKTQTWDTEERMN